MFFEVYETEKGPTLSLRCVKCILCIIVSYAYMCDSCTKKIIKTTPHSDSSTVCQMFPKALTCRDLTQFVCQRPQSRASASGKFPGFC